MSAPQSWAGGTADAIRNELRTGNPTEGRFRFEKGDQYINGLGNWLRRNPGAAPGDVHAAEGMLQDLIAALSGD